MAMNVKYQKKKFFNVRIKFFTFDRLKKGNLENIWTILLSIGTSSRLFRF